MNVVGAVPDELIRQRVMLTDAARDARDRLELWKCMDDAEYRAVVQYWTTAALRLAVHVIDHPIVLDEVPS